MAERKPLVLKDGKISELPVGDTVAGASSGSVSIPQLTSDPVAPTAQSSWVLATPKSQAGSPIGLLLAITSPVTTYTYALRFRTLEGTTVGTPLT